MSVWPIEISDNENIVRSICTPYHVKKNGTLKHQAFDPTPGTDEVSVIRSDWIGADACKQRSKKIEDLNSKPPKIYQGLAVLSAQRIRQEDVDVIDSRIHFVGHADIRYGFKVKKDPNEPNDPDITEKMREIKKNLADLANYHPDPNLTVDKWEGPALKFQNSSIDLTVEP